MNNEYPEKVLEAYDTIERLLFKDEEGETLYRSNTVTADCLLFILNNLYELKPETK
jgi:hypothetical protein